MRISAKRTRHSIKLALRSYDAFAFLTITSLTVAMSVALSLICAKHITRVYGTPGAIVILEYLGGYWLRNWLWGIGILAIFAALLPLKGLELLFHSLFERPLYPTRESVSLQRTYRIVTAVGATLVLLLLAIHVPITHLRYGRAITIVGYAFVPMSIFAVYVIAYRGRLEMRRPVLALASHAFDVRSFNVAGHAHISSEAAQEIDYFVHIRRKEFAYIIDGDPSSGMLYHGHKALFDTLSHVFSCKPQQLRLFTNTTAAIECALKECCETIKDQPPGQILTTDADYDSVREEIGKKATTYHHEIKIVEIANDVRRGMSAEHVMGTIISQISSDTRIMCLSHVLHKTGFIMDSKLLVESLAKRKKGGRPYVILDAAQAFGQIAIAPDVLDAFNYVATSGHKWLLSEETIGILRSNENPTACAPVTYFEQPSGSLSKYDSDSKESLATIVTHPRLSLAASLSDLLQTGIVKVAAHNLQMRTLFMDLLSSPRYRVVENAAPSGICLIETPLARKLYQVLSDQGIIVGLVREAGPDSALALRICFHYYHSEADVRALVHALLRADG